MRSKLLNSFLLGLAVVLDAAILSLVASPALRLGLGIWLLSTIVVLASRLELEKWFGPATEPPRPTRRFGLLRHSVDELLSEVRRLNWLVVDLDRRFRDRDTVAADIAKTERHMAELLKEIRRNAGKPTQGVEAYVDPHPLSLLSMRADRAELSTSLN